MKKTIQSTPITFIDQTDSRKLEVYITSNMPTVQIFNGNSGAYTPDWREGENLVLSMDVFLDSRKMTGTEYNGTAIKWYKNDVEMSAGSIEDISDDKRKITIKDNILKDNAIITYTCEVTYQGIVASTRITFTRVDTGLNGAKGADGTSVRILGNAKSVSPVTNTSYYTITYDAGAVVAAALGDAYVYGGELYVCSALNGGQDGATDYFVNVGRIQGEAAKSLVLLGNAQVFHVNKESKPSPSTINITPHTVNFTDTQKSAISWEYRTTSNGAWSNITSGMVSISNNTATINGDAFVAFDSSDFVSIRATFIEGEETYQDIFTVYKAFDGIDGSQGDAASMAFLTNENMSFAANARGVVTALPVTTNVVAYNGTNKQMPSIGNIIDIPNGMSITIEDDTALMEKRLLISFSAGTNLGSNDSISGTITIPVLTPIVTNLKLSWAKVNAGAEGVGINSVQVEYGTTDSATEKPATEDDWQTEIPVVPEGHYLWTRTIIDYTDPNKEDTVTYTYAKQGTQGERGVAGSSITVSSIQYKADSSATSPPTTGWSNTVVATSASTPFLWTKTTFSDNNVAYSVSRYGTDGNRGNDGRGVSSIAEQYYQSTSATSQSGGSWSTTVPTWADGKYIWTRSVITYTDNTTYTTSPICVTGQKGGTGGTGATGVGVSSIDIWYYQSTSATSLTGGSWSTTAPTWSDGKYVWTKTITTYTNSTTDETAAVCITGQKGSTGVGVKSVTEYYLATASSSSVTISTTGWTTAIQTITADKRYLWNYEIITYTDNTTSTTNPVIIGVFGNTGATGATGKGIKSITEYYLATTASSGVATTTTGWTTTMQTLTATNKYLWNYELITYTDNSTATINPVIIGVYGDRGATGAAGADAYTVLLTNESHVFAGSTSSAVASNTTTQILAYKGTAAQSVTIVSVNGVAAATASTATGIAGLSFACSALSGTSPTVTFTCTTAFVSPSGTIPIVLSVGGVSVTKMFTYSIAFKGATGSTGTPSSSYWLVSNASAVQKTSSGDILCTPATLTFTGRIQTGSSAPANYACRWILATSTDGSTYTDAYTSTANEATVSLAASSTYKAVRARMYLAGGTTTLLDEQIIPFVSDGETGAVGATGDNAVTFQVYSNNGYALSAGVPTLLLQTFAYFGDVEITAGATFQWYRHNNTDWVAVSGATNAYFNVSRDDVSFSNNYMCKMQFNGTEYVGVVTIEDKNDENKVFASKPSNYFSGDLWIVGTDYVPSGFAVGTMLRAEHTNSTYTDSDWVSATKYDDDINSLRETVDEYKQYFSVNSANGLQIGNSSINNDVLTIDTINATSVNSDSASFESLDVVGRYSGSTMLQAPVINLGNFSLVIESNGSLSIVANT